MFKHASAGNQITRVLGLHRLFVEHFTQKNKAFYCGVLPYAATAVTALSARPKKIMYLCTGLTLFGKKIMKKISIIFALLYVSWSVSGQSAYQLRFANADLQCAEHLFCVDLQVATTATDTIAIGSHSIIFSYNTAVINSPTYQSWQFNDSNLCVADVVAAYLPPAFSFDAQTGEGNITTTMQIPNMGCPLISNDWITMGQLCFTVVGYDADIGLQINAAATLFNLNNDQPAHTLADWQTLNLSPNCTDYDDPDNDGLINMLELLYLTNPNNPDTDDDTFTDGDEVLIYLTNPSSADTDTDGLTDTDEINTYLTNPNNPDTDGDGLNDTDEINTYLTNPNNPDTDTDGLTDDNEINTQLTNPTNPDTDGDGVSDGIETDNGNPQDTDTDGISDANDPDDDNDSVATANEDTNLNGNWLDDDDNNNGIPDYRDPVAVGALVLTNAAGRAWSQPYPNPATDAWHWQLPPSTAGYASCWLYSAQGQLLAQTHAPLLYLPATKLACGTYLLVFANDKGVVVARHIVVKQP